MEERINSELESLKIQVKLLETELEISRMRAESCEEELRQLKATLRLSAKAFEVDSSSSEIPKLPPPPPPLPPPPPVNPFNTTNNAFRSRSNSQTMTDAITDAQQKLQQSSELKIAKKATGRDWKHIFHHAHELRLCLVFFTSLRVSLFHPRDCSCSKCYAMWTENVDCMLSVHSVTGNSNYEFVDAVV